MLRISCFAAIISICLVFSGIAPAMAQEEITEAELEKAAKAYVDIGMINQDFQIAVQEAADEEERQKLQKETHENMIQAVEKAGLDVATYNKIMNKVGKDEETAQEFHSKVQNLN